MKPLLLFFCALFLSLCSLGQNPYLAIKADSVVIYDYNYAEQPESGYIIMKGVLSKEIKKSHKLDTANARKLTSLLNVKSSYGQVQASCFYPHLGIVYWKNGKPLGYIDICMGCDVLRSNKRLVAQEQGKQGEGKNAYYLQEGMSKSFRQFLNTFLVKYNFSHQINKGDIFDK